MRKRNVVFLLLFITSSCIKEIPIESNNSDSKLVVNSIITADSTFKVHLSQTLPITSNNKNNIVSDASVSLFEDGILIDKLTCLGNGIYESSKHPSIRKTYAIKAEKQGYTSVTSTENIPEKTDILKCSFGNTIAYDYVNQSDMSNVEVTFKDNSKTSNFYELIFFWINPQGIKTYISSYSLDFDNKILNNEGNKDYLPSTAFFSDELFNGKEITINIKIAIAFGTENDKLVPPGELYAVLRTTSESYYNYRKMWTRHNHNKTSAIEFADDIFKGEPIEMFSNINNGYGVFVGYSEDIKKANYISPQNKR